MPFFDNLIDRHVEHLEDFWRRKHSEPYCSRDARVYGRRLHVASNDERLLTALDHSLPLFSVGPDVEHEPMSVTLIALADGATDAPLPANLMPTNRYTAYGRWMAIDAGQWGHAQIDLAARSAHLVVNPTLAERPDRVSSGLLNTVLLNLIHESGFGMLHCTALMRDNRLLMLMAPHNTGKSTTALSLLRHGYRFVSDSQLHVSPDHAQLTLFGFPVGIGRLRADMLSHFREFLPLLTPLQIRNETKYVLNLREALPEKVEADAVTPKQIDLCLLSRAQGQATSWQPAADDEVWESVMHNSMFYNSRRFWQAHLTQIDRLIDRARCWQLTIGSDIDQIAAAVAAVQNA